MSQTGRRWSKHTPQPCSVCGVNHSEQLLALDRGEPEPTAATPPSDAPPVPEPRCSWVARGRVSRFPRHAGKPAQGGDT
jgi:hypothetical protein